jgi:hypothetical protein
MLPGQGCCADLGLVIDACGVMVNSREKLKKVKR